MVRWDNNMAERDVIIFGAWDSRHCAARMSIRPPFEASPDPSNDERSATVSKFRLWISFRIIDRENWWIDSREKNRFPFFSLFFFFSDIDGLNAFVWILSRIRWCFLSFCCSLTVYYSGNGSRSNIYLGIVRWKIRSGKLCELIINFDGIVARGDKGN